MSERLGPIVVPTDPASQVVFIQQRLTEIREILNFVRIGSATPEGAVTAPIGTLFLRLDGGASTTLYIKESGTGNTGWIAK